MDNSERVEYLTHNNVKPGLANDAKLSHEARLYGIIDTTFVAMVDEGREQSEQRLENEIKEVREKHQKAITPNMQEEIKLMAVCLSLLAAEKLKESLFIDISELILEVLDNKSLSQAIKLRISLLESMAKIMPALSDEKVHNFINRVFSLFYNKEMDPESQSSAGLLLSEAVGSLVDQDSLKQIVEGLLMKLIKSREATVKWTDWL